MAGPFVNTQEFIQQPIQGFQRIDSGPSSYSYAPIYGSNYTGGSGSTFNFGQGSGNSFLMSLLQFLFQQGANNYATDKQNAYNLPERQMQRLVEAGINPYSAVGQIAGNNTSAPYKAASADFLQNAIVYQQYRGQKIQNDISSLNLQYQRDIYNAKKAKMLADANRAYWTAQLSMGKVTAQEALNRIYNYKAEYTGQMMSEQEIPFSYFNPEEGKWTDASFIGTPQFYLDYIIPRTLNEANLQNISARTLGQKETNARLELARAFEAQFGIPWTNNNNFVTALKFFVSPEGKKIVSEIVSFIKGLF